jgi:hypothetical protein
MSWMLGILIGAVLALAALAIFIVIPVIKILIEYSETR